MQSVKEFCYIGRILTSTDDDWTAVARKLQKARATWGRLARILGREGADPKVSRNLYIAVTQQVLLFGAETWVLTVKMEVALDAFQGRVARRLTGRMPHRGRDGKWRYLPLAGTTKDAGIVRSRKLVLWRQNTVAQFVATRPILVLCEGTERRGVHGSPKDGGNSPGLTGGLRGRRMKELRRREKHTQQKLQGGQFQRRRQRHQDRKRERGRRRHWGPVAPVGRNGAGRKIKKYSFSDDRRYTGISSS